MTLNKKYLPGVVRHGGRCPRKRRQSVAEHGPFGKVRHRASRSMATRGLSKHCPTRRFLFSEATAICGLSMGRSAQFRHRASRSMATRGLSKHCRHGGLVLGSDGNLWLEHGPFGKVPPPHQQIDGNARAFQALSDTEVLVLGSDGNLWLEHGPFGKVPPPRQQIDGNVRDFQALSTRRSCSWKRWQSVA